MHEIINQVNRSFITPIDREDIILIAKVMDNINESIDSTAHRRKMFNIGTIREEAFQMTSLISICTKETQYVVNELEKMKKSRILHEKIVEVNRIENQGDEAYGKIIQNLFLNERDAVEIIKWREIYEYLEKTLDACEDVANVIEGIVSKNV